MASLLIYLGLVIAGIIFYLKNKLDKTYSYFKKRGIPELVPEFLYGNARELIQKKVPQGEFYQDVYKKFKKMGVKHGGIWIGDNHVWVPIDPELIKAVIIKDFDHFNAHYPNFGHSIMFRNIFLMSGDEWRDMRRKLTPTFTSGKMKMMFNIVLEKSNGLADLVGKLSGKGEPVEMKETLARYTTDIIGNCGFGIECNSLEDKDSEFFRQGQNMFEDEKNNFSLFSALLSYFGLKRRRGTNYTEIENFFSGVVKDTIEYREKNKIVRKDFLHLMIQLKNKGTITELTNDKEDIYSKTVDKEVISLEDITGQCLLFFNAGFETSSSTLSFALLELTQYQDIQEKIRKEVREVLKKHNGNFSYEALQEMTYCENVINETLRKYPVVPILPRICTKAYKIPGTDSVIDTWSTVTIPTVALHMDPDYFPDPEKFDPDRFSSENKSKIKDFTYLPFGEGPRMCLGMRFAFMQSKAGLAKLIDKYNFTLNKMTPYPPQPQKTIGLIAKVDGGVWLNATKVD